MANEALAFYQNQFSSISSDRECTLLKHIPTLVTEEANIAINGLLTKKKER